VSADRVDDVLPILHASDRWHKRAGDDSIHPAEAWREASQMAVPEPEYRNVDEARYHRPTHTVLLRQGAEITTTLSMDPDDVDSPQGRALRQAVEAQFGPVENRSSTANRFTEP